MSETREQFRERMGFVNYMGALAHVDAEEARADWNDESQFTQDAHKDAAEAGYAQALRDFKEHLLSKGFAPDRPEFFAAETDVFAAERGIEIGGEQ